MNGDQIFGNTMRHSCFIFGQLIRCQPLRGNICYTEFMRIEIGPVIFLGEMSLPKPMKIYKVIFFKKIERTMSSAERCFCPGGTAAISTRNLCLHILSKGGSSASGLLSTTRTNGSQPNKGRESIALTRQVNTLPRFNPARIWARKVRLQPNYQYVARQILQQHTSGTFVLRLNAIVRV